MLKRKTAPGRAGENRATARFSLPLVAVWVIPLMVTVGAFLFSEMREESVLNHDLPRVVTVGSTTNSSPTPVNVMVRLGAETHTVSRTSGIVTAVHVSPATALTPCMDLYSVNDVIVRAQVGAAPLVADVQPGQSGADVARTSQLLADCGVLSPQQVTDKYNGRLREGIDSWNRSVGLPTDGIFRSEFTTYIGPGARLDDVLVRAGVAVEPGDNTTVLAPEVRSVVIAPANDATLIALGSEPVTLTFGSESIEVPSVTSIDDATALLALLDGSVAAGTAQKELNDTTLVYSGGIAQLATPETFATVPNSAVYVAKSGHACVFTLVKGGDVSPVTIPDALPDSASLGVTLVPRSYAGDRMLRNYRDASDAARASCT